MVSHSPTARRALVRSLSCHAMDAAPNTRNKWRRVGTIVAALLLISGGVAFAVSQHWIPLAVLQPLLFALPCALIVLLCFRGARPRSRPEPNT